MNSQRASRAEIFVHLEQLLGASVQPLVAEVTEGIINGRIDESLDKLKAFDAQSGGVGLHELTSGKLPGEYRAVSYIGVYLYQRDPEQLTRVIVTASCSHVEAVLKRMIRLGLLGRVRADLPLGALLHKVRKSLPDTLFAPLDWLNSRINTYAKHKYDFSDPETSEPEHYFQLDEAIAVYLIARKLVVELETLSGKSREELSID